jgi:hypothetical protein
MPSGHSGSSGSAWRAWIQMARADLDMSSLRNVLVVRATLSRSDACRKPKICSNRQLAGSSNCVTPARSRTYIE